MILQESFCRKLTKHNLSWIMGARWKSFVGVTHFFKSLGQSLVDSKELISSIYLKIPSLHKICENKGFYWPVFSCSLLYGRIRVNESPYFRIFYVVLITRIWKGASFNVKKIYVNIINANAWKNSVWLIIN